MIAILQGYLSSIFSEETKYLPYEEDLNTQKRELMDNLVRELAILVDHLANGRYFQAPLVAYKLSGLGKQINGTHPFNAFECFSDEQNIEHLRRIFDDEKQGVAIDFLRQSFLDKNIEFLAFLHEMKELLPYVESLSRKTKIPAEDLGRDIEKNDWVSLMSNVVHIDLHKFTPQ